MSVYDHRCGDCQFCPACGKSAWCENDYILSIPCEHHGYCGDCNVENCLDCRLEAEREMYETGEYDPRSDPFIDHTAANQSPPTFDPAAWMAAIEARAKETGFDPTTNSYRSPK